MQLAFWNLENLMDTINDPGFDNDFTPSGSLNWNSKKYQNKVLHVAQVISDMQPDIMGLAEVENRGVLDDLVQSPKLKSSNYGIVHFDSPDERGIDVALLYNPEKIKVLQSTPIRVQLPDNDATRDILYVLVVTKAQNDTLHLFVNHWPSRRGGEEESAEKRKIAAKTLVHFIDSLGLETTKYVVMGDFNDDPQDASVAVTLGAESGDSEMKRMVNLPGAEPLGDFGTCTYKGHWNRFDQLMLSHTLYQLGDAAVLHYKPNSFDIYNPKYMTVISGSISEAPFRNFKGKIWQNGYSDHFPVMAELWYE